MSSYKFEFKEYAWDLLYFLIMKRFNFDMEFIRKKRYLYEKPIVMNLEHENKLRQFNRNKHKDIYRFFANKENLQKKICNKNFPVCVYLRNPNNRKSFLIEFWIIKKNFKKYFEMYSIKENYFFNEINELKNNEIIVQKTNDICFSTAKNYLEILGEFKKLKNITSKDVANKEILENFDNEKQVYYSEDMLKIDQELTNNPMVNDVDQNKNKNDFKLNLKENENDHHDENEIKELKRIELLGDEFSKSLDKLKLKKLEIINMNLKVIENSNDYDNLTKIRENLKEINLITNYDLIENYKDNLDILDDLIIERNIHVCNDYDCENTIDKTLLEDPEINQNSMNKKNIITEEELIRSDKIQYISNEISKIFPKH